MTEIPEIKNLVKGDERAFRQLIDLFSDKVFNLSLGILQDQQDAQDVTQEIFTTIFLSIGQFKGDSKLSTWIYRIAVNKCREHIRKRSRKKRFGFQTTLENTEIGSAVSLKANFFHPGIELEEKERAAILFAAIDKLPENQKVAFSMHKLEGIPYEEIASIMEVSLSSVESLIFRARQNLRKLLEDYYEKNER
ncbi:MAG: RNA polymerase sigma factor [Flavobacteriia bacterium]